MSFLWMWLLSPISMSGIDPGVLKRIETLQATWGVTDI